MKTKKNMFLGLSVERCWVPLTATYIDANNMLQATTKSNEQYCHGLVAIESMLKELYKGCMDADVLDRFTIVFTYVMENKLFGNAEGGMNVMYVSADDVFELIKKNWNRKKTCVKRNG